MKYACANIDMHKSNMPVRYYRTIKVQIFSVTRILTLWANLTLMSLTPSNLLMKRYFGLLYNLNFVLKFSWDCNIFHFRFGPRSGCLIGMEMAWSQRRNSGVHFLFRSYCIVLQCHSCKNVILSRWTGFHGVFFRTAIRPVDVIPYLDRPI